MILSELNALNFPQATVLTLGTFDGVHRGHQALVAKAKEIASSAGLTTVALTFPEPPQNHCNGKVKKRLILPPAKKREMLKACGIETVVMVPFQAVAGLSPRAFANEVLKTRLNVAHVVVGYDCRFGKDRAGDAETLNVLGRELGFGVSVVEPVVVDDVVVSSTEVRRAIQSGDIMRTTRLLGYVPFVVGTCSETRRIDGAVSNVVLDPDIITPDEGVFGVIARCRSRDELGVLCITSAAASDGKMVNVQFMKADAQEFGGMEIEMYYLERLRGPMSCEGRFVPPHTGVPLNGPLGDQAHFSVVYS